MRNHHSSSSHSHGNHRDGNTLVAEATPLLERLSPTAIGEEAKEIMSKVRHTADIVKSSALEAQKRVKAGVHQTEKVIVRNPWRSLGLAVGLSLALGYIFGRFRGPE